MQTSIIPSLRDTADGREADRILRACTHCGFCTATCPTYQLLGDERDGPRGRIYLIKQVLEGASPTTRTQQHLDQCLTCRACETTCPSGVQYARLADIGRELVEQQVERPLRERVLRWLLRHVVAHRRRFELVVAIARTWQPLLRGPLAPLAAKLPRSRPAVNPPAAAAAGGRLMLLLDGCVQPVAAPNTNAQTRRVLAAWGIRLLAPPNAGCCGALSQHLGQRREAADFARANIDAWWPYIEAGAEALVTTASGCGAQVAEYGYLLREDPAYAARAARVSSLVRDLSEVIFREDFGRLARSGNNRTVAYHPPCTLQNAPGLHDHVPQILGAAGYRLTPVANAHLCCGSAGSYSLLQPGIANRLRDDKLRALDDGGPELIATANIGCQMHLEAAATHPVRHWIELIEPVESAATITSE